MNVELWLHLFRNEHADSVCRVLRETCREQVTEGCRTCYS